MADSGRTTFMSLTGGIALLVARIGHRSPPVINGQACFSRPGALSFAATLARASHVSYRRGLVQSDCKPASVARAIGGQDKGPLTAAMADSTNSVISANPSLWCPTW